MFACIKATIPAVDVEQIEIHFRVEEKKVGELGGIRIGDEVSIAGLQAGVDLHRHMVRVSEMVDSVRRLLR